MNHSWQSYPSIYNLGHKAVRDLLNYPHVVEEKVDGSQFSFGLFNVDITDGYDPRNGEQTGITELFDLKVRSKGAIMVTDAPEKMFAKAVESVKKRQHLLHPGWTYRGEYLQKPKHNTLVYDRVPKGHVIIFDVSTGNNEWLSPLDKMLEAERIGLECVPTLNYVREGVYADMTLELLRDIIDNTTSVLGGQKIEGVVIKPLVELYGVDKKTLMGKFVSERFKEAHKLAWGESNPGGKDILGKLSDAYGTPGRWHKAIQHLREAGQLEDSPRDIGKLMIEIQKDTGIECKEEIQKILWKWAWPHVSRAITRGFPEFYKDQLLKMQFEGPIELECEIEGCSNLRYEGKYRCKKHLPGTAIYDEPVDQTDELALAKADMGL